MITALNHESDLKEAREFLRGQGLAFEEGADEFVGMHEQGSLIAVGARARNILKMIAVAPAHQGGPVLGEILTALVERGFAAGFDSLFVFTKPEHAVTFEALNFTLLASQARVSLLEFGGGFERWLAANRRLVKPGRNGGAVVNCNPFTLGHRYLIETAARQVDHMYVFVVREDRSVFPFDLRFRLVREGVADIANVEVLDTSHYAVSGATFPTYFLKRNDPAARIQMELDVTLFAARIAPFFGISTRFVGTEPICEMTNGYNDAMKRVLPAYGIGLVEIERKQSEGAPISASRVRKLLDAHDLAGARALVPDTTYAELLEHAVK